MLLAGSLRDFAGMLLCGHTRSRTRTWSYMSMAAALVLRKKARAVAVAENVVETMRLFLNSASNVFANGLRNSSGHLGTDAAANPTPTIFAPRSGRPITSLSACAVASS
jgi:hypothetical protein